MHKKKKRRSEAPYIVIAKVGDRDDRSARTIRHHVNNLMAYTRYLDKHWRDWRWFNVFNAGTREQVANFTKFNRPSTSKLK